MLKAISSYTFKNPSRLQVDRTSDGSKSVYGQQVNGMNYFLDKKNVGISDRSRDSVIDNVVKVERGERSEINAHQREVVGFARDAFESFSKGNVRQGSVEAAGSVLNAAGSVFKSTYTQTPHEKQGIHPW
ncbi:hypothetical protein KH5H1_36770 [Corallococcus caeni]|uniref:Uncharacterized protein n=2 Tax=Corallococcus TaxID=83461 RepID=A0A7Y4JQX2_9BACT|nr:hypothetical protein [Corallococcus exercitus]NOK09529.1 hypothetical protein [Corallococcus exercitus]GMT99558.1 hypothetical protein KH5H1_36770 [Corallococcus sp. KH5-1]GMU05310.1 hypothetical protein ASNO1_15630 [Corallococcus sp. NO1]